MKKNTPITKIVWSVFFVVTLLFVCSSLLVSYVGVVLGEWQHDGGFYLLTSSFISKGFKPYVDFSLMYPPLVLIINSLPISLGFDRLAVALAIPMFWNTLNTLLTLFLTRFLTGRWIPALLLAGFFPIISLESEGNGIFLEHAVVSFSLLGLITACRVSRPIDFFWLGLTTICIVLSKQIGIVSLIPIIALCIDRFSHMPDRKSLFFLLAGLGLPVLAILMWINFDFKEILNLWTNLYSYASTSPLSNDWSVFKKDLAERPLFVSLFLAMILFCTTNFVIEKRFKKKMVMAAFMISAVIYILPRTLRDYGHYNLNTWPLIVGGILVSLQSFQNSPKKIRFLAGGMVAFSLFVTWPQIWKTPLDLSKWKRPNALLDIYYPASQYVKSTTTPADRILQFGEQPIIEFLSDRLPQKINLNWDDSYASYEDLGNITVLVFNDGEYEIAFAKDREARIERNRLLENNYKLVFEKSLPSMPQVEIFSKK